MTWSEWKWVTKNASIWPIGMPAWVRRTAQPRPASISRFKPPAWISVQLPYRVVLGTTEPVPTSVTAISFFPTGGRPGAAAFARMDGNAAQPMAAAPTTPRRVIPDLISSDMIGFSFLITVEGKQSKLTSGFDDLVCVDAVKDQDQS